MSRVSARSRTAGFALFAIVLGVGVAGANASRSIVAYNVYPLISDGIAVTAPLADASLVNGWGLSASATSPWWTANNKTNTSTLYTGVGSKNALTGGLMSGVLLGSAPSARSGTISCPIKTSGRRASAAGWPNPD